uniref:Uncharacterized protein n=1 Tax=Corvus moneduloides TaxID=1196302 RepID=A0A8C3DFZ8_CORMO
PGGPALPGHSPPVPARTRCPVRPPPPGQRRHPPLPHGAVAKRRRGGEQSLWRRTALYGAAAYRHACRGKGHLPWFPARPTVRHRKAGREL